MRNAWNLNAATEVFFHFSVIVIHYLRQFFPRNACESWERDKTADFKNRTKQPILKQYKTADW